MRTSILLLLGLVACDGGDATSTTTNNTPSEAPAAELGEVLATVNGMSVGSVEFEAAASRVTPADGKSLSLDERKEVLDRLVDDKILYQEALRRGLDKDPKVQKVMVNTLLRDEVYANVKNSDFTDAELEAYYQTHVEEFVVPEKVQIKRILIRVTDERSSEEAKAIADSVRADLAGDPAGRFKDAATEHSEDPYRRRGGDVGFVSRDGKPGLDQEIVDKAFTLDVNQLSEVFESTDGWNILYLANKRERVERTFLQMKGSVLRKVKNDKLKEMYDAYVAGLKQGATVEINEDKLASVEVTSASRPSISPMEGLPSGERPALPTPEGGE